MVKPSKVPSTKASIDEKGDLGNGVTVEVAKVEGVTGDAQGPGEVAGPALRVTILVSNSTKDEIPMDLALVNVFYGKNRTPASSVSGPGAKPLSAPIKAGTQGTGSYVFSVPKNERKAVAIEFSYTTDAPTVIFTGSV